MNPFPHHYSVEINADSTGKVDLNSHALPTLQIAPPEHFGGPGDQWSPETLLTGAVAACFVLSFRAISRASHLEWSALACHVEGILDRVDGVTRFVGLTVHAKLSVPAGTDADKAQRALAKAEKSCLVSNSLSCDVQLETELLEVY